MNLVRDGGYPRQERKRLREAAAAWEGQWGPEGLVKDGDFVVLEASQFKPNYCAKFPHFANKGFHAGHSEDVEVRARRFALELRHALDHDAYNGKHIGEIFNDPDWQQDFRENWQKYAGNSIPADVILRGAAPQGV